MKSLIYVNVSTMLILKYKIFVKKIFKKAISSLFEKLFKKAIRIFYISRYKLCKVGLYFHYYVFSRSILSQIVVAKNKTFLYCRLFENKSKSSWINEKLKCIIHYFERVTQQGQFVIVNQVA